jgi:hypothetical protein
MRTIKFRGKTTKGAWLYGDLEHCVDDGTKMTYIFDDVLSQGGAVLPETVGQFTGLKDKNNNEIYEGDILQMNGSAKLEVQFLHGGFGYCLMFGDVLFGGNSSFQFNPFDKDESFEVIGNIHDNEDLMPYN